jgi:UDP-N-acetylmuramoyl-tripeptide--D-alanyl-D-alanine ligase
MMERLAQLAARLDAPLHGADAMFERVCTDTRQLAAGDLFVALRGDRFDGHDYLRQAEQAGAAGALVSRRVESALPQVCVPDTLQALQTYATLWRGLFELPVVAVTGSNGKTTTKQLLASIFAARGPVLATAGNLNNHIGVPLTLLQLRATHRTAVIEMGANHAGEIALLTRLAAPNIGVVTQAGDAHLEGFGSREGVARAKGELFAGLRQGVAVINADDAYAPLWTGLAADNARLSFGIEAQADIRASQIELLTDASRFQLDTPHGSARVRLPLPGRHNILNSLAAAACAVALGMDTDEIASGLEQARNLGGRLSVQHTAQGAQLVDDSYNANPGSLRAGMEWLAGLPGERWLILGDMAELGSDRETLHRQAGEQARQLGIQRLYTLGALAALAAQGYGPGAQAYEELETLVRAVRQELAPGVTVLIKGSRSARMERVVAALTGGLAGENH